MGRAFHFVEDYWIFYYLVFLATTGVLFWQHWGALRWGDESSTHLMASIFESALGVSIVVAMVVEVTGHMVLLIPRRVRKLREQGREEGRQQGREEGREEGREAGLEQGLQAGLEQGIQTGREQGLQAGRELGLQAGRELGLQAGRDEERQEWLAWYDRQQAAFRDGKPFDEPPPAGPIARNGR